MTRSACLDPETGQLLHAYELGLLDETESNRFEQHLLECEYCFTEVEKFRPEIHQLIHSQKVRRMTQSAASRSSFSKDSNVGGKRPANFKALAAVFAALILLMIYPAYMGMKDSSDEVVTPLKEVGLVPSRSGQEPITLTSDSPDIVLVFLCSGAKENAEYSVILTDESSGVVYQDTHFRFFDRFASGRLYLPRSMMSNGNYKLTVTDNLPSDSQFGNCEYFFKVILRDE